MVELGTRCGRATKFHSCQAWSRQKCFGIVMTVLAKIFSCNSVEKERIEKLSQQDRVIEFCADAGFLLTTVEIGQSFQDERYCRVLNSVVWREYTLTKFGQETEKRRNQKVAFEGTPILDPHWKLQFVAFQVNVELRSVLSLWRKTIRIHGTDSLTTWNELDMNNKDQVENE